jgi:maltooligosyltrehalose trehalohydrolase
MEALGLIPLPGGGCSARVWAPNAERVAVVSAGRRHPLEPGADGVHGAVVPLEPGDDYRFELGGGETWPDPCSRAQPDGVRGDSRVVDVEALRPPAHEPPGLDDLVVYELHVGTFSPEGTFDGATRELARLRELGVTAVELMPVATFPGNRGWGYDGLYLSAPHPAYGGPDGLARFVRSAHEEGLSVLLDVVYNHAGPGNEALRAFGPYLTDRHETIWGDALDYRERGVREWAIQNAEVWVRDNRIDGLRHDAAHAIHDETEPHVLAELARRVRAIEPRTLLISEMGAPDFRPLEDWGHDGLWVDNLHHALHVALTGERDGYYAPFDGSMRSIAEELRGPHRRRIVASAQNHDQVGNRAIGDRLPPEKLRVAQAVVLFSPCTPLLFQGEEHAEQRPFQFFSDHVDPAIAAATRDGRRREFAAFAGFAGEVPDPQDPATFERSRLSPGDARPDPAGNGHRDHVARLLRLRRELPDELEVVRADEDARVLELRRGPVTLVADFAAETVELRA